MNPEDPASVPRVSRRAPAVTIRPVFTGWPPEAFELYAGLVADNSRTYWHAHRDVYDGAVRAPFLALSDDVTREFGPLHLFRPNRDTRFAKDKSPYKTAAAAVTESAGGATYYVQLSADGVFAGSGMYHMASDQLERWRAGGRRRPQGRGARTRSSPALRAKNHEIGAMESLKTAPRGYAKDHPRVELLRQKGLVVGHTYPYAKWMHTRRAFDRIVGVWRDASAMNRWLERNVGPSTQAPPEPF